MAFASRMRSTINVALRQPSLSLQLSLAAAMVARPAARFGGEWAGWCCTYGSETGTLRRVNEQYLSDTAVEYGQVPAGFEECTTESWEDGALVRRSVRLLPETGCAVDNLAAEVSRATLPAAARLAVGARACAVDALAEPGAWRCETVFGGLGGPRPRDRRGAIESSAERTRVAFTFDPQRGALAAVPVVVWQERRWSEAPSLQVKEDRGSRSSLSASWVDAASMTNLELTVELSSSHPFVNLLCSITSKLALGVPPIKPWECSATSVSCDDALSPPSPFGLF